MVRAYGNHWTRRTCGEVHDVFALETGCIHVVIIYLEQVVASLALRSGYKIHFASRAPKAHIHVAKLALAGDIVAVRAAEHAATGRPFSARVAVGVVVVATAVV